MLADLGNIDLDDDIADDREERTRDIRAHFSGLRHAMTMGTKRRVRDCNICKQRGRTDATLVSDVTTLRRHMEAKHKDVYLTWCRKNDFESKLPRDVQRRKSARAAAEAKLVQTSLDNHLAEKERVVPYSHAAFKEAAMEWLLETDQSDVGNWHWGLTLSIESAAAFISTAAL
ncbi:hypothetical protein EXIGLDRAFT_707554 [Exidia glandulosa HHB12029]|uniref:Uncharacterized protein n=1 Tax=Exidia glandulosa HHB12029 TaxID=1314781 RepID=A0A165JSZ7_EXIGL|nr:hypothetical protein EXIGLDRAFT_707554 [Exidia glandulosa HHB12029]